MRRVAIIPARGGSKRLPGKNLIHIAGAPTISYPLAAAIGSGLFDEVVVSSDHPETLRIAETLGAVALPRPSKLATDTATVDQLLCHILSGAEFADVDAFCCIYATAVLIEATDLRQSLSLLDDSHDFVMGVSEYPVHPFAAMTAGPQGATLLWPDKLEQAGAERPAAFASNGTLYWCRRKAFLAAGTVYGGRLATYLLPPEKSVDINTQRDLELADFYMQRRLDPHKWQSADKNLVRTG